MRILLDEIFSIIPPMVLRSVLIEKFSDLVLTKQDENPSSKIRLNFGKMNAAYMLTDYTPPFILIEWSADNEMLPERNTRYYSLPVQVYRKVFEFGDSFLEGFEPPEVLNKLYSSRYEAKFTVKYYTLNISPVSRFSTVRFIERIRALFPMGHLFIKVPTIQILNKEENITQELSLGEYAVALRISTTDFDLSGNALTLTHDKLEYKFVSVPIIIQYCKFREQDPWWYLRDHLENTEFHYSPEQLIENVIVKIVIVEESNASR